MKGIILGALAGAGLLIASVGTRDFRGEVCAQQLTPDRSARASDQLIAVPGTTSEKGQLLTVIDPKLRVMSVYHIDALTGKIALRSVRNITWDLQMTEFDNDGLPPREIRSLLEQR